MVRPGTTNGQTVDFAQVPTSITFIAGHRCTFIIYATRRHSRPIKSSSRHRDTMSSTNLPGTVKPAFSGRLP